MTTATLARFTGWSTAIALVALTLSGCAGGSAGSLESGGSNEAPESGDPNDNDVCISLFAAEGMGERSVSEIEAELGITFPVAPDCAAYDSQNFHTTVIWKIDDDPSLISALAPLFQSAGYPDISVLEETANYFNGDLKVTINYFANDGEYSIPGTPPSYSLNYPDPSKLS